MSTKFAPLTIPLIEEGRLEAELAEAFKKIQQDLIEYVEKYGVDKSAGAVAKLTLGISVKFEGRQKDDYSIKGDIKTSVPNRPSVVTMAIASVTQTDEPSLFVRRSGSSASEPHQHKLCGDEGEKIDPESGEIIDE